MFGRKSATKSRELLEYLARAHFDQHERLRDQLSEVDGKNSAREMTRSKLEGLLQEAVAGHPTPLVSRLVREGKLEWHRFHTYKLRATLAGNHLNV